jgi:predicted DNA binding CopG/RHH family protein
MKSLKKIPTFKDEDAEREFWAKADSTEYIDWSKAEKLVLPNFRPTLRTISLRLPESMIAELKLLANQRDVPYQSLLKVFLAERIRQERGGSSEEGKPSSRRRADPR